MKMLHTTSLSDKVAFYVRLSDEDRDKRHKADDSESIQNQKSMLINYAMEQGWGIYEIYSDDDYSGVDSERPKWNELIKDAEGRKFNIVLCKTQARFTRDMELVEKYLHKLFPIWGVRFVGFVDNADTAVASNKKARQINGLVNEWYLEDLSANVTSALDDKRYNGKYIGSIPLYGYLKDPSDHNRLVVDEEAAAVVRRVFMLYLSGFGICKIAQILNDEGVLNPTNYKWSKGFKFKPAKYNPATGHLWSFGTIRKMLTNEMYIGTMVQGVNKKISYKSKKQVKVPDKSRIKVEGTHEAIVDAAVFERVRRQLGLRTKQQTSGQAHIFAGKLRCVFCGAALNKNSAKGIAYLRCYANKVSGGACAGSRSVQFRLVEDTVLAELKLLLANHRSTEQQAARMLRRKESAPRIARLRLQYDKAAADAEGISKTVVSLYSDKVKGVISEAQFLELNSEFAAKKEQCVLEQQRLLEAIEKEGAAKNNLPSMEDVVEKYYNIEALDSKIVGELIDYIEVGRDAQMVYINIHWAV